MGKEIHLDCISSRSMRDSAKDELIAKYGVFSNPLANYRTSHKAAEILEISRENIANSLGIIDPEELHFTSGPEESSNWAIKGAAWKMKKDDHKILYSAAESVKIKNPIRWISKSGYKSTLIKIINEQGINLKF